MKRGLGDDRLQETVQPLPAATDADVRTYNNNEVTVSSGATNKTRFSECLSDDPTSYPVVDPSFDVEEVLTRLASAANYVPTPERRESDGSYTKLYAVPLVVPTYAVEVRERELHFTHLVSHPCEVHLSLTHSSRL